MTEQKTLILEAGEKHASIEVAKAGIETAKALIEAAKAGLEAARANLDAAKSDFDEVLERCEQAGLVKSKVKKAAEMIGSAFAEAGIENAEPAQASSDASAQAPAPVKRAKKRKAEDETPAHEPLVPAEAVPSETVAEALPTAVASDLAADITEVQALVEDLLVGEDERVGKAVTLLMEVASKLAFGRSHLDIETFRNAIDPEGHLAQTIVATAPGGGHDLTGPEVTRILEWTHLALTAMENEPGKDVGPLFPVTADAAADQDVADVNVAPDEAAEVPAHVDKVSEVSDEPEATAAAVDADEVPAFEGEVEETHAAEDNHLFDADDDATFDDDASFPVVDGDGDAHADQAGEVIGDIGGINFLEEEEAPAMVAEAPKQPEAAAPPAPSVPAPPKVIGRPTFIKR